MNPEVYYDLLSCHSNTVIEMELMEYLALHV